MVLLCVWAARQGCSQVLALTLGQPCSVLRCPFQPHDGVLGLTCPAAPGCTHRLPGTDHTEARAAAVSDSRAAATARPAGRGGLSPGVQRSCRFIWAFSSGRGIEACCVAGPLPALVMRPARGLPPSSQRPTTGAGAGHAGLCRVVKRNAWGGEKQPRTAPGSHSEEVACAQRPE